MNNGLPTSKQQCKHFPSLPAAAMQGTATVGPFVCPWCEIERLRRALELRDLLESTMEKCIGVKEGQTFEDRAEELIVTEVQHQQCSGHETTAKSGIDHAAIVQSVQTFVRNRRQWIEQHGDPWKTSVSLQHELSILAQMEGGMFEAGLPLEPSPCNPCTQWDEDGLCVTCGASMPKCGLCGTPGITESIRICSRHSLRPRS